MDRPASRQPLLDLAGEYARFAGPDAASRLKPLTDALTLNLFRVVVAGEVKKGKSSFLNALLGDDLLPVAIDVATSIVFKIAYGPAERFTVFFQPDDGEEVPPRPVPRGEVPAFGTEDGNPGNAKRVDFIAVELPHPLLADGLVLIDTPGVGGLVREHRDITFRYAPHADAVCFVLDSLEAVVSEAEVRFLEELRGHAAKVVFLQTKIDAAGAEQVDAWQVRNRQVLARVLKVDTDRIPYFPVGAKLKQFADRNHDVETLRDSGYPAVLDYLRTVLVAERDELLARRWLPVLSGELGAAGTRAVERLTIARGANQPQAVEYEARLAEAEQVFERWQTTDWPAQLRTFQDAIMHLRRDIRGRLQDDLSSDAADCVDSLEQLRAACRTADDVNARGDQFLTDWAVRWSERVAAAVDEFRIGFADHLAALVGRMAESLQAVAVEDFRVGVVKRRADTHDPTAAVRDAVMSSNIFGGLAGEAAKWVGHGAALAVLAGVITNPIGLAVGATAGAGYVATRIWMAVRGYRVSFERQRDAAAVGLERALGKMAATAQRNGLRLFDGLASDLDAAARDRIDEFRTRTRQEFLDRRQELVQARSRTTAEAKAAEDALAANVATLRGFVRRLQDIKAVVEGRA